METRQAQRSDLDGWMELRKQLWPHASMSALRDEAIAILDSSDEACFLLFGAKKEPVGFAEAAVYTGPKGPHVHVEGWYVVPELRGLGHGKELIDDIECWCLHRAICLLTSDTIAEEYPLSTPAHIGSGFRKLRDLTIFVKELQQDKDRTQWTST